MKIVDVTSEIVETIWTCEEKGACTIDYVKKEHEDGDGYVVDDEILSELERSGLVEIHGPLISLTAEGKAKAQPIIRRHRLAERLLTDVLGMTFEDMEEAACEYEHTLAPGLTEAICTLLGHPRDCPHGSPIPEGECCQRVQNSVTSFVKSLDAWDIGDEIRICFIRKADPVLIGKLISMGVAPGKQVKIRQKFPAYVIQIDHTQIAIEQEIAAGIYGLKV